MRNEVNLKVICNQTQTEMRHLVLNQTEMRHLVLNEISDWSVRKMRKQSGDGRPVIRGAPPPRENRGLTRKLQTSPQPRGRTPVRPQNRGAPPHPLICAEMREEICNLGDHRAAVRQQQTNVMNTMPLDRMQMI